MRVAWVLLLVACHAPSRPAEPLSNHVPIATGGLMTISEGAFGPLDSRSAATLPALRAAFSGYDVRAATDSGLTYSVYLGSEKLAWVIPNANGTLFNVHATSPKVQTVGHDWRVGEPFEEARYLSACECWGENPTCYRRGDHIAVNFKRGCDNVVGVDGPALHVLDGTEIQRVIWSPTPFRGDDPPPTDVVP